MSLFSDLNFLATVLAFGTVSFAASNFGTKLGRVSGFINRSGYQYVSELEEDKKDALYKAISESAGEKAPYWTRSKDSLRSWCEKNEKRARKWNPASQYCVVKNTVKHQLLKQGKKLLEGNEVATVNECNDDLWNSYDDGTGTSKGYLFAMTKCIKKDESSTGTNIQVNNQVVSSGSSTSGSGTQTNGSSPQSGAR